MLLVGIEDVLSGREQRQVDVVDADNLLKEISEVVALRKSCELGHVVEANIDDPFGATLAQEFEKHGSGLFRETDGVDCGFRVHRSRFHPSLRRRFRVVRRRRFPRHVACRPH